MKSLEKEYYPENETSSVLIGIVEGGRGLPKHLRFSFIISETGFNMILK
jgi:hypothetical protein